MLNIKSSIFSEDQKLEMKHDDRQRDEPDCGNCRTGKERGIPDSNAVNIRNKTQIIKGFKRNPAL